MKTLIVAATMWLAIGQLWGQVNSPIERGYLITKSYDTVKGEFFYKRTRALYREAKFKEEGGSYFYTVTPKSVEGFFLSESNRLFLSKNKFEEQEGAKHNFLQAISVGELTLLTGLNDSRKQTYWAIKNERLVPLEKGSTKTITIAGNNFKVKTRPYLNALSELTNDCPGDSGKYELNFHQLKKRGVSYANCKGTGLRSYTGEASHFHWNDCRGLEYPIDFLG